MPQRPVAARAVAWVLVALAHGVFFVYSSTQRVPPAARPTVLVSLRLLPLPPPEPPPPPPPPPPPEARPPAPRQPRALPRPETVPAPRTEPLANRPSPTPPVAVPPAHAFADSNEWVAPGVTEAGISARRAPSDYAAQVKARVIAQVVYPPDALYPAPRGYKGDPRVLMRQCTIPYEVVVDRQGMIVSYEIERCHDDLLDAAAEAAIIKAKPFPPPPDGAEQYRIYGTVNFIKPRL